MSIQSPRDRRRIPGALLVTGAVLGLVGNALHPHTADASAVVTAIAGNGAWVNIHLAIMVAIVLIIGGLIGLTEQLQGTPGAQLARFGLAAALLGGSVVTVSTSIDGFAMKTLAVSAAGALAAEAATAQRVALAVKDVDFAIWSIGMLLFFGAAFACFGLAVAASPRYRVWFGWVAVLGAGGSALAAVLQIEASGEVQAAETLFFVSSALLTLWVLALGILVWRGHDEARVDVPWHGPEAAGVRP